MKKLIIILLVFVNINCFSQSFYNIKVRNKATISNEFELNGNTVVDISTGDTLTTNEFVRILIAYAISNISENEIIVDSIRAKNDSIYMKSPFTGNVARLKDSLYASYLLVEDTGKFTNSIYVNGNLFDGTGLVSLGTDGQIPYMNLGGTDLAYGLDFKYLGDTLNFGFLQSKSGGFAWNDTTLNINFGTANIFIGSETGGNITSGTSNSFYGYQSGFNNTTGSESVFSGYRSGYNNLGGGYSVFIGYEAGYSNTSGTSNQFTGYQSGYSNISGNDNSFVGTSSGYSNTTGYSNVLFGHQSGYSNISGFNNTYIGLQSGRNATGSGNVFIGYRAGRDETGSNKLYIENTSGTPLIYGEFDNDKLIFNTDTTINRGHLIVDSTLYAVNSAQYSVINPVDITIADTWLPVKVDTMFQDLTTSGFELNADSTGFITRFDGVVQISGHASVVNNSAGQVSASVYIKINKNDVEISQFNTALEKNFAAGDFLDIVSFTGNVSVNKNDTLFPMARTSNVNIDLEIESGIFDDEYPFTLNFTEIPIKKQ